jgi:putative FmdB family regulatory protein
MPLYDYRCASGHVSERHEGVDVKSIECPDCGSEAQRAPCSGIPEIAGYAPRPTKAAPLNVSQFQEAHGEMLHKAERHGVEPPDLWKAAKARVRKGDAVAIE